MQIHDKQQITISLDDILTADEERKAARATVVTAKAAVVTEDDLKHASILDKILEDAGKVTDCLNGMTVEDFVQAYKKIGYRPRRGLFEHKTDTQCCGLQAYQNATGKPYMSLFGQDVISGFIAGFDGGQAPVPGSKGYSDCRRQGYELGKAVWNAVKDFPGGITFKSEQGPTLTFKVKKLG